MSRNFELTPEADADVRAIWQYIADDDSEVSADRVVARIYAECEKLGEMPSLGHFRDELVDRNYKFWSVWSYLVVYEWGKRPILVISVVHGARDLDVFLTDRL